MKKQTEAQLQDQVCNYIRLKYPKVLFNSDLSGIKLTMGQAIKVNRLRSSRGFPDIVIYVPNNSYHALFIELKKEGTKLLKKNGEYATDHIKEQAEVMNNLRNLGYYACFAVGFEEAKREIDFYLKNL